MAENTELRQETTLRDFLNVIFRRKWVILAVVGLATVTVFYLNARRPAFWESTSRILVERGERDDVFSGRVRYLSWEEEVSSQIEVILSETVFAGAKEIFQDSVAARGLPADVGFYPGQVRADVVGESNVFAIRYTDLNPQLAQLGCEAMTISFRDFYLKQKAPPELEDFFVQQINDVKSDLDHWQAKRNEFLNKEKFFGMVEEGRFLMAQIGTMERELVELESDISVQVSRVDNLFDLNQKTGKELERELAMRLSGDYIQESIVERIKLNLQTLNMRREELMQKYTDKHPEVIAVDEQINGLQDDLKREIENAYRVESQELTSLYQKKVALVGELEQAKSRMDVLPDKDHELDKYDTIISNLKNKYELLLKKQSETDIAIAGRTKWDVTVLSHASAPYSKKTKDYVRLALGPLLSIIVGLGLAFFLETLDHSVKNMSEAEEYLELPVLATISEVSNQP
ncbi:MAG: hypothetical protein PVF33_05290 [Candidatus Latescibacterota bacterium]|jgi:uncharacterized protein involved in exopolysaccharide biosynthesis